MLTGRTIQALAQEINEQRKAKLDMLVSLPLLGLTTSGHLLNKQSNATMPMSNHAHRQISSYLDIPRGYYDRMRTEAPELLVQSFDTWASKKPVGAKRFVRTLHGQCRAFLSDSYLPIDNHDVVNMLLPAVLEAGCEVVSCDVTESKMYIKAVTPRITGEIAKGDIVQAGLVISNSEIGAGRVSVEPLMYRLVCSNGLIVNDMAMQRHHLGRRLTEDSIEANGWLSREAVAADVMAYLLKARDTVKAVLNQTVFSGIVGKAKAATQDPIHDVEQTIENVTDKYSFTDEERNGIMASLISGGDLSRWGLVNAITATAHEVVKDYDRSTELEKIGGSLLFKM